MWHHNKELGKLRGTKVPMQLMAQRPQEMRVAVMECYCRGYCLWSW